MTWPRAFLPVPTSDLTIERRGLASSPKATPEELRKWMGTVPEVYRVQCAGTPDADFKRMADAPRDEHERVLGETYRQLFSSSASAHPLRAEFIDGQGLVVQSGQHRVLAAQETGVPYVPVHVAAPDEVQLEHLRQHCEDHVRQLGPEHALVPEVHRRHDEHLYPERHRSPDHHPGRERLEPERERDWSRPERER